MPGAKWYTKKRQYRIRSHVRGINILSIDGGGARGLSSLVILHEVMKRIQRAEGLLEVPDPEEYFDLMGGTGTGGISVAMVGRLRMPTEVAVKAYVKLAEVFSEKKVLGTGASVFKASKLEAALKEIIHNSTGDANEPMAIRQSDNEICKTMIFAMSKHNMNAGIPCIFRSYPASNIEMPNCTIWEVLRATTAHPDLFKSIDIGEPNLRESFIDGGLGCNNPLRYILEEAALLFPDEQVASIVSIGAGQARTIQIPKPSPFQRILPIGAIVAMKDIAADSERVAHEMAQRFRNTANLYFRFNVEQGIQNVGVGEWERLPEVNAHTRAYMQHVDCDKALGSVAKAMAEGKGVVPSEHLSGQVSTNRAPPPTMPKLYPTPTPVFVGYENVLERIRACLVNQEKDHRVFVLHGLGGMGKTQITSRFIEMTYDHWKEVIYLDGSSREAIISSLQVHLRSKGVEVAEDKVLKQMRWPFGHKYLLVFDGADDPTLDISMFFPDRWDSEYCSTLITTRNRDLVLLARGPESDYQVTGMPLSDSRELLLKAARIQDDDLSIEDKEAASALIKDFGYLPLAIVHAGTYIWRSAHNITQYRETYHKQKATLLEEYGKLPIKIDEYNHTVHAAWTMSYKRLSDNAKKLLWLLSFLHPDGISIDMFRRAKVLLADYKPILPPTESETKARTLAVHYLDLCSDTSGQWDETAFSANLSELLSFSLLRYDRANQTYSLHALVHTWASTLAPNKLELLSCVTFLLAISVGWDSSMDDISFRRRIVLHVDAVLSLDPSTTVNVTLQLSRVYLDSLRLKQAEVLITRVMEYFQQNFGDKHPETLKRMDTLASLYARQDQWKKAEILRVQILKLRKEVLGLESAKTLDSLHNLAETYSEQGRFEESEAIATECLYTRQRVFGEGDPSCFRTIALLSDVLTRQNKVLNFKKILEQSFYTQLQTLGQDMLPAPVAVMDLAFRCARQNHLRFQEKLLMHRLCSGVFRNGHPHRLRMEGWLATAYYFNGDVGSAEEMWEEIVNGLKLRLGEDHPSTLSSMGWLAESYHAINRLEEAETLQKRVVELRTKVLGVEHSDTLTSANSLVAIYQSRNQLDEAEELQRRVANNRAHVLGQEHYQTLASWNNLAKIYRSQGRLKEAEDLSLHVVGVCKRALGEEQVGTLTSMSNLAVTYRDQGRLDEAEELQARVVDTHKRLLGNDNPDTTLSARILAGIHKAQGRNAEHDAVVAEAEALGSNKLDEGISWRYDYFRTLRDS